MDIFTANRIRNRFAEPTSVQIGIGKVCEFHNLQIGIGIIFVRWKVFSNYSRTPRMYFFSKIFLNFFSFLTHICFLDKFTVTNPFTNRELFAEHCSTNTNSVVSD